jgi:hypothetical protein
MASPNQARVSALVAYLRWSLIEEGWNPGLLTLGSWLLEDLYAV